MVAFQTHIQLRLYQTHFLSLHKNSILYNSLKIHFRLRFFQPHFFSLHKNSISYHSSRNHFHLRLSEPHFLALHERYNLYHSSRTFQSPSYASILHHLRELKPLQQVHANIVTSGHGQNIFLSNRLLNAYVLCGFIEYSGHIFRRMPHKNVVSYTAMINGFSKNGLPSNALRTFYEMKLDGVEPNEVTVVSVLPVCGKLGLFQEGRLIHSYLIQSGLKANVLVNSALVDVYAKCGSLENALQVFDKMKERNIVSWNTMISGYLDNGFGWEALNLFNEMKREGVNGDAVTCMSLLCACEHLGCLKPGCIIHGQVTRSGFELDRLVGTRLIQMYVKCGSIEDAHRVFDNLFDKDVVSWTIMILSFSENGHGDKAVKLFYEMQAKNVQLDSVALMGVLSVCGQLGVLGTGVVVHGLMEKTGFGSDVRVGTAIIDMYAKCGSLDCARKFFNGMFDRDVVSWNAMIVANGINGHGDDAIDLLTQMEHVDLRPNESTLVCVLCACSHAGLVDHGLQIFNRLIRQFSMVPNSQHYACVIDLLGRAGRLDEAYSFIKNMPMAPDAGILGALLGACRLHRNIGLGVLVAKELFELNPKDAGYYVLLSNMYAMAGLWDGVSETRVLLRSKGLKKTPGCSLIEIDGEVHAFIVGNTDHPEIDEIYKMLKHLILEIQVVGYVPDTKFVVQDVPNDVKEEILCHHSEKLAIAFGLLRTPPGTTIRITKNLRICDDCHTASKFISKVVGRIIIMRDAKRFHHFRDGRCSCGDYW
ncbi:hypothetical protein AMTRI_Chr11g155480 [Amborella trichopoda]